VAHDLNNILTVVEGHTSLQLAKAQLDADVAWSLRQVQAAGLRAAALTRQLLAFGRKQIMLKRAVSLSAIVGDIASMLRRLIEESITITFEHEQDTPHIFADVCNIEQILINLAVNARDAMPQGGAIAIRTDQTVVTAEQAARSAGATPGHFVRLTVTDNGEGMSPETLNRIFEPFFTTKPVGKGTGMGLSTVLGIIQQHEGWIEADSHPGKGTSFRVYFPATELVADTEAAGPAGAPVPPRPATNEMILLVEDDEDVRSLARCVLEDAGYRVMEADNGHRAIATWREFSGKIDLLITDMVMPGGLSGTDVARQFRTERPGCKVIFSSGYSEQLFGNELELNEGLTYLPKPYLARQLTETVSRALSTEPKPEPATA
jgi:CheY-like chemotaxis protein